VLLAHNKSCLLCLALNPKQLEAVCSRGLSSPLLAAVLGGILMHDGCRVHVACQIQAAGSSEVCRCASRASAAEARATAAADELADAQAAARKAELAAAAAATDWRERLWAAGERVSSRRALSLCPGIYRRSSSIRVRAFESRSVDRLGTGAMVHE